MTNEDQNRLATILKTLTCSICNNILSVAPIMTINSDEHQCGRCQNIKTADGGIRNTIFESVAQQLNFPCMNSDCTEMLPWKDVKNHERDCLHTTIICPSFHEKCEEKIALKDLGPHMVQKHGNNIFFEKIEFTIPMFKSFVCVAVVGKMEFLIYICNDKVLVTSTKSSQQPLTYSLKISSTNENSPSLLFQNQAIDLFNERLHCFRCLDHKCELKHHPFSNFYQAKIEKKAGSSSYVQDKQKKSRTYHNIRTGLKDNTPPAQFSFSASNSSSQLSFSHANNSLFSPIPITNSNANISMFSPITTSNASTPSVATFFNSVTNLQGTIEKKPSDIHSAHQNGESAATNDINDQLEEIKCTTFNLIHVQNLIGMTMSVKFVITFSSDEETEQPEASASAVLSESHIPRSLISTIDNSDLLRKVLECPICNEFMVEKIFVCERGHPICSSCKTKNSHRGTCPSCMGVLADSRSIALETLADDCSICCCYKKAGCEFRGNLKVVAKHEEICDLQKT